MYSNVIPIVQGLAYRPGQPNPLQAVGNAYGMWEGAMQYDPSGSLLRSAAQNAAVSAVIGAAVGSILPGFTIAGGVKWGALLGAAQTVFAHMKAGGAQ